MNLLSAFGGGLWIIPLLFLIGIVIWIISGLRSAKSGSAQQDLQHGTQYSDIKVPFVKSWQLKFAIFLALVLIGVIIWMYSER